RQIDATQRNAAGNAPARTEAGDNLRLVAPETGESTSGSEAGTGNDASALQDQLALAQESLDSSERENLDLKDRLNDLQGQLDKLQRLMELKDSQLASLQAQLAADSESAAPGSPPAAQGTDGNGAAAGAGESPEVVAQPAEPSPTATPVEQSPAPTPAAAASPAASEQAVDTPGSDDLM